MATTVESSSLAVTNRTTSREPSERARGDELWKSRFRPLFPRTAMELKVALPDGTFVPYVNLDHAATTLPFEAVAKHLDAFFDTYGSVHRGAGQKSMLTTERYDRARDRIRRYVGGSSENYVIFAKNTTEAINQAATLWATLPGRVLVSDIEHSSNLLPWVKHNAVVQYRTRPDGTVDLAEIEAVLRQHAGLGEAERIKLVTFTACSNITGYSPPIYEIARLAHRYGAKVLADMCQHIPHEPVDMLADNHPAHLDFVAFSGHKMYAPYGIGVLLGPKAFFDEQLPYHVGGGNLPYITRNLEMKRYFTERAHDPGTPNAMGPIALAKAMDIIESVGQQRIVEYERALVRYAFAQLHQLTGVRLYVHADLLGHVIPFDVAGWDARLVATVLAQEFGIGLRAGAFCTYEYIRKLKGVSDEDDAQIAAEVDQGIIRNIPHIVRASFSICNPFSDCDQLAGALARMIERGVDHYLASYVQDPKTGTWSPVATAKP